MYWKSALVLILVALFVGWLPAAFVEQACSGESPPVITPGQIEADWLRQDALRGRASAAWPAGNVTPEQDAAGGCDGVKTGKWGFHTAEEANPWWQVDLGKPAALDRVVIYNRCDGGFANRASRIMVLLSADAQSFKQAYQHDGTVFGGQPDNHPLSVPLKGQVARYVRLQLPGHSYFHLDEVEVYGGNGKENLALHRPATQSSVSEWSVAHSKPNAVAKAAAWSSASTRSARSWSAASAWPRTCGRWGPRSRPKRRRCGKQRHGHLRPRPRRRPRPRPISKPAGRSADWRCATPCWISIRSCSSSTPPAGSPTCPTSSTVGGRGRAAGSFCSKASRATGRRSAA